MYNRDLNHELLKLLLSNQRITLLDHKLRQMASVG